MLYEPFGRSAFRCTGRVNRFVPLAVTNRTSRVLGRLLDAKESSLVGLRGVLWHGCAIIVAPIRFLVGTARTVLGFPPPTVISGMLPSPLSETTSSRRGH